MPPLPLRHRRHNGRSYRKVPRRRARQVLRGHVLLLPPHAHEMRLEPGHVRFQGLLRGVSVSKTATTAPPGSSQAAAAGAAAAGAEAGTAAGCCKQYFELHELRLVRQVRSAVVAVRHGRVLELVPPRREARALAPELGRAPRLAQLPLDERQELGAAQLVVGLVLGNNGPRRGLSAFLALPRTLLAASRCSWALTRSSWTRPAITGSEVSAMAPARETRRPPTDALHDSARRSLIRAF